jgi:NADH dehydrogenase [ubiquinone] 1 alpha subcomplex assembly factor 7
VSELPEISEAQINTPLAEKIKDRIQAQGPLSVSTFMRLCLHDPDFGYYQFQSAIGGAADFITAPEISQVFGELVGIWAAVTWRAMGAPPAFNLVELGPGRGTLMQDALRAGSVVPGFVAAARIRLVESNRTLVKQQQAALAAYADQTTWHSSAARYFWAKDAPLPTIVLANEYLDTFAIEQWVARDGAWQLRAVGVENGALVFTEIAKADWPADVLLPPTLPAAADGTICQTSAGPVSSQHLLAKDILAHAGEQAPLAALFIDYGFAETVIGDTLQAMSEHKYVSPFRAPGCDDVTAHVDFSSLAKEFRQTTLLVDGPITQTEFLLKMGLVERAQALMREARADQVNTIETGARRIADPDGMGGLFKVMAVRSPGVPVLPPFSTPEANHEGSQCGSPQL